MDAERVDLTVAGDNESSAVLEAEVEADSGMVDDVKADV